MSASFVPLRALLGVLCVFFAYYLGRSLAARAEGTAPNSRIIRWGLRVTVTALGVAWVGIDAVSVISLGLAALSAGLGLYAGHRPRRTPDDLTNILFPKQ
jgi:hypothetical protein